MDKANNKTPKISLIVPVYNIENYVEQCLDSILKQDMEDFEIIVINDGSTDKSRLVLEKYAKKDPRINLINLENGGVSRARNQGVAKAAGEYILFVDGDDFILPNALSNLYNYAHDNNADVVIFCYMPWINGVLGNIRKFAYPAGMIMDAFTATKIMLLDGDATVWNKIIRRNLYVENNITFEYGTDSEDIPVSCKMLIKAKRIIYFEHAFYAYVYRTASTVNSSRTSKYVKDVICNLNIMGEEIKTSKWKNELADAFDYRFIGVLIGLLQSCYSNPKGYKSPEELQEARFFLEERFSEISLNRILSNHYLKNSYKLKAIRLKVGLYKYEKLLTRLFNLK